jgi:hypothetical protein
MVDTDGRAPAVARALALTTLSLAYALGAHVLGGGDLPGITSLAALGALAHLLSIAVARGPLRTWTVVPALGVLQLGLHHGMALLAPTGHAPTAAAGHGSHAGHGVPGFPADAVTSLGSVAAAPAHATSTPMLVAHAVAVLATAVTLVSADRAARAAWHWWTSALPQLLEPAAALVVPGAASRADHRAPTWARPVLLVAVVSRRGPPASRPAAAHA